LHVKWCGGGLMNAEMSTQLGSKRQMDDEVMPLNWRYTFCGAHRCSLWGFPTKVTNFVLWYGRCTGMSYSMPISSSILSVIIQYYYDYDNENDWLWQLWVNRAAQICLFFPNCKLMFVYVHVCVCAQAGGYICIGYMWMIDFDTYNLQIIPGNSYYWYF